jgi:hypothetical protein
MSREDDFLADLEKLGEQEVRNRYAKGMYGNIGSPLDSLIQGWLRSKEDARKSEAESRKESREEMSLFISRRALRISWFATIIATIAMILNASDKLDQLIRFLRWLGVLKP